METLLAGAKSRRAPVVCLSPRVGRFRAGVRAQTDGRGVDAAEVSHRQKDERTEQLVVQHCTELPYPCQDCHYCLCHPIPDEEANERRARTDIDPR